MDAHDRAQQGPNQRDQGVKYGNRASNNVGNDCDTKRAGEPADPVRWSAVAEMARIAKNMDKYEFRRNLSTFISLVYFPFLAACTYMGDDGHADE